MKKLNVSVEQSYTQNGETIERFNEFTINVLDNGEQFSAKHLRKIIQRGVNNVMEINKGGFSKGRRFILRAEFDECTLSPYTTFYNSNQAIQANFNRALRQRLNALVMDIKDIMTEERKTEKVAEKVTV